MNRRRRSKPAARCFKNQLLALRNPALWTLALASAFMYIDRYAVNSWGIFFLEQDKAYSTLEASGIIGVNAIAGIAGTIIAGMLSDRFFPAQPQRDGRIHQPAEHRRLRPDALVAAQLLH